MGGRKKQIIFFHFNTKFKKRLINLHSIVSLVFVEGLKSAVCVGSYCFMPVAIPRWYGRVVVVRFMKYFRWLSRYEFVQKTDERGALFVQTVFAIVAFVSAGRTSTVEQNLQLLRFCAYRNS